jgi:hypothetical protein
MASSFYETIKKYIPVQPDLVQARQYQRKHDFHIAKSDDEKQYIFGWAQVANNEDGSVIEDWQGDIISPEDLEQTAYSYVLDFRDTGERHDPALRKKGKLIESCVFTKEKMRAIGIPDGSIPEGWWAGFHIEDPDAWAKIKSGEYQMFSVEGTGERVPIDDKTVEKSHSAVSFLTTLEKFLKPVKKRLTFKDNVVKYNLSYLSKGNPNHDKKGRFASGGKGTISAIGANKFKIGFKPSNLKTHYAKHKKEYPGLTEKQYADRALELIQKPCKDNIKGYYTKQNRIVRYDVDTEDFVSGHPEKGIATLMNLKNDGGIKRFMYLQKRDKK